MQRTTSLLLVAARGRRTDMKKLILWVSLICLPAVAQILAPIFFQSPSVAAGCGGPVTTNLKGAYFADCMTAGSANRTGCSTSYTDGHGFVTNETWHDISSNANDLVIDFSELQCVFKTNKINGLPAVSFNLDGGGNCGWRFTTQPDSGATSWAIFAVFQAGNTGIGGSLLGPHTAASNSNTFLWVVPDSFTECPASSNREQSLINSGVVLVGCGNASPDTSWHQLSVQFSNLLDQNTAAFRIDRGSDGPSSFTSSNIGNSNGGIGEIGVRFQGSVYSIAIEGRLYALLIYAGTGAILTGGNVTTNETMLNCLTGL